MDRPFANGRNGDGTATRGGGGRFLRGNKAAVGRGNPHAARVNAWRRTLTESVTEEDLRAVVAKLVERAKAGQPWAIHELLDRCLGRPTQQIDAGGDRAEPVELVLKLDQPLGRR